MHNGNVCDRFFFVQHGREVKTKTKTTANVERSNLVHGRPVATAVQRRRRSLLLRTITRCLVEKSATVVA